MSPGVQILTEVIQSGGEAMHFNIHEFISSVWNKK
jgi:hypothetical protein